MYQPDAQLFRGLPQHSTQPEKSKEKPSLSLARPFPTMCTNVHCVPRQSGLQPRDKPRDKQLSLGAKSVKEFNMLERLSARQCQTARGKARPVLLADGGGLYLRVTPTGAKSWLFRYQAGRKQTDLGLGPYPDVGLAEARAAAATQRRLRREGIDPKAERRRARAAATLAAAKAVSFADADAAYLRAHASAWKGGKDGLNAAQWRAQMDTYAMPLLGKLPVAGIDTGLVLQVVEPIWEAKRVTADRVRRRIESVLDFAAVSTWREGENPARWAGHLEHRLASVSAQPVKHHAALPHDQVPEFIAALRSDRASPNDPRSPEERRRVADAVAFLVLTASRSDEVLGAVWGEFDLPNRLWVVPKERAKGTKGKARERRVPLSDAAMALLPEPGAPGAFVFASSDSRKPYRHIFRNEVRRLGYEVTPHGFRSTFRDWAAEHGEDRDLAEMALAHAVGTRTERAYLRTDMFAKRRALAERWARYCTATPAAKVLPLRG